MARSKAHRVLNQDPKVVEKKEAAIKAIDEYLRAFQDVDIRSRDIDDIDDIDDDTVLQDELAANWIMSNFFIVAAYNDISQDANEDIIIYAYGDSSYISAKGLLSVLEEMF